MDHPHQDKEERMEVDRTDVHHPAPLHPDPDLNGHQVKQEEEDAVVQDRHGEAAAGLTIDPDDADVRIAAMALGSMRDVPADDHHSAKGLRADMDAQSTGPSISATSSTASAPSQSTRSHTSTPTSFTSLSPSSSARNSAFVLRAEDGTPLVPVDASGNPVEVDPRMMGDADFLRRLGGLPIVRGAMGAWERGKMSSRVVKYGAEIVESSVKTISKPVITRLEPRLAPLDEFASRQFDRLSARYPSMRPLAATDRDQAREEVDLGLEDETLSVAGDPASSAVSYVDDEEGPPGAGGMGMGMGTAASAAGDDAASSSLVDDELVRRLPPLHIHGTPSQSPLSVGAAELGPDDEEEGRRRRKKRRDKGKARQGEARDDDNDDGGGRRHRNHPPASSDPYELDPSGPRRAAEAAEMIYDPISQSGIRRRKGHHKERAKKRSTASAEDARSVGVGIGGGGGGDDDDSKWRSRALVATQDGSTGGGGGGGGARGGGRGGNGAGATATPGRSRWQSMLVGAGVTAGGISAAVSEESMKSLKYCLQWLQYATAHIEHQITVLRDFILSLQTQTSTGGGGGQPGPSGSQSEAVIPAQTVRTLSGIKGDVVNTIRGVVDVVGKYAGAALPDPARNRVRSFILSLPERWASVNRVPRAPGAPTSRSSTPGATWDGGNRGSPTANYFGGSPASPSFSPAHSTSTSTSTSASRLYGSSSAGGAGGGSVASPAIPLQHLHAYRGPAHSPTPNTAVEAANRVLTLAVESLDILRSVTSVFGDSLERAEAWVERLRMIGLQRQQHQHGRVAAGPSSFPDGRGRDPTAADETTTSGAEGERESSNRSGPPSPSFSAAGSYSGTGGSSSAVKRRMGGVQPLTSSGSGSGSASALAFDYDANAVVEGAPSVAAAGQSIRHRRRT